MGEKEKGASRFNLTGEQTVTFERFIRTFDEGKFMSTIMLRETSSNIQKKMAWDKFTTAFNAVCKTNFTRVQLHQYHIRVIAKKKKDARERELQLAAARRYASGTGGGPPGPSVEQADGDGIDDDLPPVLFPSVVHCPRPQVHLAIQFLSLGHTNWRLLKRLVGPDPMDLLNQRFLSCLGFCQLSGHSRRSLGLVGHWKGGLRLAVNKLMSI